MNSINRYDGHSFNTCEDMNECAQHRSIPHIESDKRKSFEVSSIPTIQQILNKCRLHLGKGECKDDVDSARDCYRIAVGHYDNKDLDLARDWALQSLISSIGIAHPDYVWCAE